jgi:hypothetical protein
MGHHATFGPTPMIPRRRAIVLLLTVLHLPLVHPAGAQQAPVRIRVLDFGFTTIPPDPQAGPALSRSVAPILDADPAIQVVEAGAAYVVSGLAAQFAGTRVRVDVRLVRVADAEVVLKREVVVDLQPGGKTLQQRLAAEVLDGMRDAKLIPEP